MRIAEMRDLLEHTAIDHVYYRTYDPMVRCVGREYTAHRSAHIALLVAAGKLDWEASVAESMYWSFNSKIEQVWNLENSGPMFDTDTGEWNRPARADVVDAGAAPAFVKEIEANVKAKGNAFGVDDDAAVGKADVLYVVDDSTRAFNPEIAEAVEKVLSGQGVDFAVLAKGTDGWGLYDLGLFDLAEEKSKEFAGFIKESGAKTVVANCPAVVYSLREWYPTIGLDLGVDVLHTTEYFAQLGVKGSYSGTVTYHDPSYLCRYLGVVDEPRTVLGNVSGLELAECYFNGDKANPSGPLLGFFNQEYADLVAARCAKELALAASTVITAGPASKRNLMRVAEDANINVMDIAELLAG
jgi:Fe-S oxidoreductase